MSEQRCIRITHGFSLHRECRGWRLGSPSGERLDGYAVVASGTEAAETLFAAHRWVTAHHEAGHVVAALERGRSIKGVTIVPTEEAAGAVSPADESWGRVRLETLTGDERKLQEERLRREAFILVAGPAVEKRLIGEYNMEGIANDGPYAMSYLFTLGVARDRILAEFEALQGEAEEWAARPEVWTRIEAVASALLERETLYPARPWLRHSVSAVDLLLSCRSRQGWCLEIEAQRPEAHHGLASRAVD